MAEVFDGVCGKNVRSVWKLDRMTGVIKEGIQEMMKEAAQFSGAAAIDDSASPFDDPSSKYSGKYVLDESVRNMSGEESMKSIGGKTYKPREPLVPDEVIGGILKRRDFKTDPSLYQTLKACATLAIERYNESQLEPECTYQVVEIDEVDEKGVAGAIYYITFKAKRAGQELETVPDEELSTFMAEVFNGIGGKKVHSVWKLDVKTVATSKGKVKYPIMIHADTIIPLLHILQLQLLMRYIMLLGYLRCDPNTPNNGLSHHVELVTRARSDNGVEFLEIQNSHGTSWGVQGFDRVHYDRT
ncbi:hypothetical protein OROMI_020986 [Orobanche minor]